LKIAGKFFTKTKHRQIFLFSVLIFFIGAPITLGFLLAIIPLWAWAVLVCGCLKTTGSDTEKSKMRRHASKLNVGKSEGIIGINCACQGHHYRGAV